MRFVGFVILATLLIIAASPRLSDAQDSMKMKKRFVMCLQLDEDPPINLDRPRTFPMNLSFERVRKWKTWALASTQFTAFGFGTDPMLPMPI